MTEVDEQRWLLLWAHREVLHRIAYRRLRDRDEADDVVAEAILRAAVAPHVDAANAGGWLNTVVVNLCADRHRARSRAGAVLRYAAGDAVPAPSPEDEVCDRAEAAYVRRRVGTLPDRQRRAMELVAGGHDLGTVASTLGAPYKAVESLLGRARRSLRAAVST